MFKGTQDLPPGAINHLFQSNGGQINASTGEDRTEYHELIAVRPAGTGGPHRGRPDGELQFDPTELAHEMTVVRSELEGDSNSPGFDLYDNTFLPAAFTAHPYHWPTIGWRTDVEAVANSRDVIYDYYKQHYMPNNAVVVMVGDFDTAKAVGHLSRSISASIRPATLESALHHAGTGPAGRAARRPEAARHDRAGPDRLPRAQDRRPGPLRAGRHVADPFGRPQRPAVPGPGRARHGPVGRRRQRGLPRPVPDGVRRHAHAGRHERDGGEGPGGRGRRSSRRRR